LIPVAEHTIRALADASRGIFWCHVDRQAETLKAIARLGQPCVLLTNGGDIDSGIGRLPDNLAGWWGTSMAAPDARCRALPLGLADQRYSNSDFSAIVAARTLPKHRLLHAVFALETHHERGAAAHAALGVPGATVIAYDQFDRKPMSFAAFVSQMAQHKFVLCPRGNGVDTHRLWEALHLGCIPIVKRDPRLRAFERLPILWVDDWSQVNIARLASCAILPDPTRVAELWVDHYSRLIEETLRDARARRTRDLHKSRSNRAWTWFRPWA
jgi:hypothetical protein